MRKISARLTLVGLFEAAAIVTAAFSLATLANSLHRYLELFSHFRLQYMAAALLLCLLFVVLRRWAWAALMLAITVINAVPIAPWYLSDSGQVEPHGADIKLLQANILASNGEPSQLIDLIRAERPDVIILQEITNPWVAEMNELRDDYPHQFALPRFDAFGIAVYARDPLLRVDTLNSPPFDHPSLVIRQTLNGGTVTYVSTHPVPPLGKEGFDGRNEQLASIEQVVASIDGPKILIGDLNTTMWAHHYKKLEVKTGLRNARLGFGVIPTWPTHLPIAMIPIDHCLVSEHFTVRDIRSGPDIGSDHLPLIVELQRL